MQNDRGTLSDLRGGEQRTYRNLELIGSSHRNARFEATQHVCAIGLANHSSLTYAEFDRLLSQN